MGVLPKEPAIAITRRPRCARNLPDTPACTMSTIVELWILRALIRLNAAQSFFQRHGFSNDDIACAVGLSAWVEPATREYDPKAILSALRRRLVTVEKTATAGESTIPPYLQKNVARLAALVGLSHADCRILEFTVILQNERLLDEVTEMLKSLTSTRLNEALATLLALKVVDVRASLSPESILARSGLLKVDRSGSHRLRSKLDLISDHFADLIYVTDTDPVGLLQGMLVPETDASLHLSDYPHITRSLDILRPYLKHAVASGRPGVNIFLHGAPGTGKSQLAKVLSAELGCQLFGVSSEDTDGDPIDGERRLRAYRAAQCFLTKRKSVLVFDEVEDIFNDGDGFFRVRSTAQRRKAWMNRALEENAVPVLWLSNSISGLDAAFIRRFDMVIELPVPPRQQRARMIEEHCANLLDAPAIARAADSPDLAPAVVARAADVVGTIRGVLGAEHAQRAFFHLINNTLEAQGHATIEEYDPNRLPEVYDPAFIQADADLASVAEGLVAARAGRLLMYGPPGTGKTAYGRWIAEQLGMPLLIRRASDLMSKWVGENEKNLARAFRQAQEDHAVLLIDEVDSFLMDRRNSQRSWEVTQVNEMLSQMESFSGVFMASANLMVGLDEAALRRFDLKVRFNYLTSNQAVNLLARYSDVMKIAPPTAPALARLRSLGLLTPGDFATVLRQSRFRPITDAGCFVHALEAECAVKGAPRQAMGFA